MAKEALKQLEPSRLLSVSKNGLAVGPSHQFRLWVVVNALCNDGFQELHKEKSEF